MSTQESSSTPPDTEVTARIAQLSPAKRAILEQRLMQRGHVAEVSPIPQRPQGATIPLSFSEERIWFLSKVNPDSTAYNRPMGIHLVGPLDVGALRLSLDEIVGRHEVLRSSFPVVDGQPAQVVGQPYSLDLPITDLEGDSEPETTVGRLMREALSQPFDVERGPVVRAELYRLAHEDHVLLLIMHHIVFDGWSTGVLLRELAAIYEVQCNHTDHRLPPLPVQVADFAYWQRQESQQERFQDHLDYWKGQLSGQLPSLELPADHSRSATFSERGAVQDFTLSVDLTERLKFLSQRLHATLFMSLLAVVNVLLYRYTGQTDITVASPVAGRERTELEGLIGYFINTLLLRTQLGADMSFEALVTQISDTALAAYRHQELPFERLVQELQPERDLSHPSLFQVMFNFENVPKSAPVANGLKMMEYAVDSGQTMLDLSIEVEEQDQRLHFKFTYSTDLFEASTVARMIVHFQTLLEAVTVDPQQPISVLPLLTERECQRILVDWNATQADFPYDQTCHGLFEQQVHDRPDELAVFSPDLQLTYAQLNDKANQLAYYLLSLGVSPETMVAVCLDRSVDLIVALVGILKAGCVYVPLDPAFPPERLAFLLEDSQTAVLIARQPFPDYKGQTVIIGDNANIASQSKQNPCIPVKATDLAVMIYTSGSTGVPKGVPIEHRPLVNYLQVSQKALAARPGQRTLLFASISFDGSLDEMLSPLVSGAAIVVYPGLELQSVSAFLRVCHENGVTFLGLATALWHEITANLETADLPYLSHLNLILVGGERMLPEYVQMWRQKAGPSTVLLNAYGPTETTMVVTLNVVGDSEAQARQVSIGRPMANVQFYILDAQRQPVPVGVPGELYIGGVCLARGYWRRPELTAERFVPNPFSTEPGARLYRTGDIARYRPDGDVEIVGRVDRQLKLRGFRVELGEIEAVLLQHPQLQAVTTVVQEDAQHNKRIVAYMVSRDASLTVSDVRHYMEQRLPKFMIPSAFVWLEALPLTAIGKIDQKALPVPKLEQAETFSAPRDSVEKTLVELWERVLNVQPIGIHDNFFSVGGHSLLAVRLFSQLEKTLGKTIPLSSLFQAPTIAQLAELLRTGQRVTRLSSLVVIQPNGTRPPLFCIHPLNGGVFQYRNLIPYLGPDQPLYGLQARGMDGEAEPFSRLDDMVDHYVDEICLVRPDGPYLLCGYSFGGRVALEVGRRLLEQGKEVAFLGLIADRLDVNGLNRQRELPFPKLLTRKSETFTFAMLHLSPKHRQRYLHERTVALWKVLGKRRSNNSLPGQGLDEDNGSPAIDKIRIASINMAKTHVPRPYCGLITYFLAQDETLTIPLLKTLRDIAQGGLRIVDVTGNHWTVMDPPNAEIVGKEMKHVLDALNETRA